MQTYKLVLPEHLNHGGFLFGGNMLKWVDEAAYMAARLDYPAHEFVTIAMNKVEFHRRVQLGTILKFEATRTRVGNTSVDYAITVQNSLGAQAAEDSIFSTNVTLVCVDASGTKQALPKN